MSSDPSGHLSAERLDALAAEGAEGADRHLADCADCRERLAALVRVRGLLADAATEEPPLPPGLSDRLDAAIAAAQAERAAEGEPSAAGERSAEAAAPRAAGSADVVPLRRRPRVPRWLAAAAGLVVLGGSAVTAAELLGDGPLGGSVSESAGGGAGTEAADSAAGAAEAGDGAGVQVTASGTAYTEAALGAQVRTLLTDTGAEAVGPQRVPLDEASPAQVPRAEQSSPPALLGTPQPDAAEGGADGGAGGGALTAPEGLAACLQALGVDSGARVAVDLGTWEGQEAAVVVVQDVTEDGVEDGAGDGAAGAGTQVWVVGPRCGVDGDALLHFQRLAP